MGCATAAFYCGLCGEWRSLSAGFTAGDETTRTGRASGRLVERSLSEGSSMRFISRRGLIGLVVVLAVLAGPVGVMARLQGTPDGPSPAQDHAEVIAQGVSGMPGDQV